MRSSSNATSRAASSGSTSCASLRVDDHEKTFAIGAVDFVYRAARQVIVALEDIALSTHEMSALYRYAQSNKLHLHQRDPEDLDAVASAFGRILSARWLHRAWCLHEFNVSKEHVFLVPVSDLVENADRTSRERNQADAVTTIIVIDAAFLSTISYVYVSHDSE
jgi:hypothetical protein